MGDEIAGSNVVVERGVGGRRTQGQCYRDVRGAVQPDIGHRVNICKVNGVKVKGVKVNDLNGPCLEIK